MAEPEEKSPQADSKIAEGKKEEKKISTLESVVNETIHAAGSLLKIGLATGIPYTQASTFPHLARDTAILAGSQVAGDATTDFRKGKKYTSGNVLESSLVGTAITAPVYAMYSLVNKIPTDTALGIVAKAGAWGGLAYPAFIGGYQSVDYLIKNRTFKGLGTYLKENYWKTLKFSWKYLLPLSLLNIFLVPPFLQIPVGAALSYAFALFGAPKKGELKEEEKRDKTPYYLAVYNAGSKLAKNIKGTFEAAYAIGSTLYEKISNFFKTAAPAPAAAPAK